MSRSFSDNFLAALNDAETDETFVALVTITHPDLDAGNVPGVPAGPIRFSSHNTVRYDDEGPRYRTTSQGVDYEFIPFRLVPPQEDDGGQPTAQLIFDNVTRELTPLVSSVTDPQPLATINIVLLSDLDTVEWSLPDFAVTSADLDDGQVVLTLMVDALLDEAFPGYDFTPGAFNAMFASTG